MQFKQPLVRMPIRFCAETLQKEIEALPGSAWVPHPNKLPGNDAVRLITPNGQPTDQLGGVMAPTEYLLACPYIMEIMAEIGSAWGRSRLMGLAAGSVVPAHIDSHYYWRTHVRIHIPVITNPNVSFTVGGTTVHMEPGECWTFDSFQRHEVANTGPDHRVHLVLDTVGGGQLWDLMAKGQDGKDHEARFVGPGQGSGQPLMFERVNSPKVMSPWEMRCHARFLADQAQPRPGLGPVLERVDRLIFEWAAAWAHYGPSEEGYPTYQTLLAGAASDLKMLGAETIPLENTLPFFHVLGRLVFEMALAPAAPAATDGLAMPRRMAS